MHTLTHLKESACAYIQTIFFYIEQLHAIILEHEIIFTKTFEHRKHYLLFCTK